jgi:oxygen-independent coproporphyrinogen-3 oxidase
MTHLRGGSVPALGLYVHFPWCVAKCPYCDFNSHALRGDLPEDDYVDALIGELARVPAPLTERSIASVFFGGGTPSLFKPASFARLLGAVRERLNLASDAEITLEANPGAIEHGHFAGYLAAGINRLSLGAQSFDAEQLNRLGRIHSVDDITHAFSEARAAGFDNINLDLMFALPEQTVAQAEADLATALELEPDHLSLYQLTLEPNTVFYARPPALPDSDAAWEMQNRALGQLTALGFSHYEVSAWARAGKECAHNLNYWTYGDYLGLGAGAHAKLTTSAGIFREERVAHPREYVRRCAAGDARARSQQIDAADLVFEFMLNNLRLNRGFSLAAFSERTGLTAAALATGLESGRAQGLLAEIEPGVWCPTELGQRFLNDLQAIFLPEAA